MAFMDIQFLQAGYGPVTILRDVSLTVDAGDAVAIVGKNGAGKTTLINSIFKGTTVQKGSITLNNRPLQRIAPYDIAKNGITLSPQGRHILSHLTVRENLLMGAASNQKGFWNLDRVYDLFPILRERAHQSGTALSGGQQQMLAIGRALMGNPRILLADEPTEGLSPVLVDDLDAVFKKICAAGTGLLLVEQHLNLVKRVCKTFVVMSKGEIIDRGLIANIEQEQHQKALAF